MRTKINFLLLGLLMPLITHTAMVDLNFDNLFPVTWYQKGLASTINVWHTLVTVLETNNEQLPLDAILGKLAFGHYCLECMNKEEHVSAEDTAYFIAVIDKVRSLLAMIAVTPVMRDRADCIIDMLLTMHKTLDPLHIPSDI